MILSNLTKKIFGKLFFSRTERACLEQLRRELELPYANSIGLILVDLPGNVNELLENLAFAKYLARSKGLKVAYYQPNFHYSENRVSGFVIKLISSFSFREVRYATTLGVAGGLSFKLANKDARERSKFLVKQFWHSIQSKEDVAAYELNGVKVGRAIYDTYLRETLSVTIDLDSPEFHAIVRRAFLTYVVVSRFFSENDVKYFVAGHCVYLNWQIISDIALKCRAEVYVTYNSRFPPVHAVHDNRGLQTNDHTAYRQIFTSLSFAQQNNALEKGRKLICRRLEGVLDDSISYMESSAYSVDATTDEYGLKQYQGANLVFMLHAFCDSPHIYGHMLFADFWEWIDQSLNYIQKNELYKKYNVFIKRHPNALEEESHDVSLLLEKYRFVVEISKEANNAEIALMENVAIASVYGTVAAEFAAMRIPVLLCGDNPTSGYDFAMQAQTRSQYFDMLRVINEFKISDAALSQVYEFAYMHFIRRRRVTFSEFPFQRFKPGRYGEKKFRSRVNKFNYLEYEKIVDRAFDSI